MTVHLMAEYLCWPLWVEPEGDIKHNTDPFELPISRGLAQAVVAWGDDYDLTLDQGYPPWSGFPDETSAALWLQRGAGLTSELKQEVARSGWAREVRYAHAGSPASAFVGQPPE